MTAKYTEKNWTDLLSLDDEISLDIVVKFSSMESALHAGQTLFNEGYSTRLLNDCNLEVTGNR